jgi:hypothetical protein
MYCSLLKIFVAGIVNARCRTIRTILWSSVRDAVTGKLNIIYNCLSSTLFFVVFQYLFDFLESLCLVL